MVGSRNRFKTYVFHIHPTRSTTFTGFGATFRKGVATFATRFTWFDEEVFAESCCHLSINNDLFCRMENLDMTQPFWLAKEEQRTWLING